ncbi:aldehyde dehydrogenase family protein, partial [bacterium M00.F.Ca.ET.229.01.1.1]
KKASNLTAGDPREGKTPLGSLVSAEATSRIRALVDDAVSKGAKLVAGGGGTGTMLDAIAIDGVTPAMRLYSEESFGPVVSIIRAGSVDEAVSIANETEFGLSAAIFGRDQARALAIAARIESG